MVKPEMRLKAVGVIRSELKSLDQCPKQNTKQAPEAVVELKQEYAEAAEDLKVGQEILLLTWFHLSDRDTLKVHPRGDMNRPLTGVFSTRSPARPNPIAVHHAAVTAIDGLRITLDHLEALDGTPVLDIKVAIHGRPA
jgi:L-fuculose-phosphate aldolase